jgi:prephenate dehydrogenase
MKQTMGIVGFGRFGRFAASHLRNYFDLSVFDRADGLAGAHEIGVRIEPLQVVAKSSIVLLCVPISQIRSVLLEIGSLMAENSLVVDTCSVKGYPVFQMETILPSYVEILGTHPLFGPDSAAKGLQGKKIVLCPIRIRDLSTVKSFLNHLGLKVLICSPEYHDRLMACTQAIVQFLGRSLLEIGMTRQEMATPGYETLFNILDRVQNDTWELFRDLQTFNPFAKEMRGKLIESLITVNQRLDQEALKRIAEKKIYSPRRTSS